MPVVALLLAVLALHVGLRLVAWHNTVVMMNDGVQFLWQAERLLDGDWLAAVSHPYHPLYAASTALCGLAVDDLEWAGVLASIAASAALTVACWALARRLFPDVRGAALGAALAAATNARSIQFGSDVQAEMLMAALIAWGLYALLVMAERHGCGRRAALAGLLTGLAYLTRFEGLIVGLPLVLWLVGARDVAPSRRLRAAGLYGAGLLLCVVPYVLAMHEVSGRWGLSLKPSLQRVGLATGAVAQLVPEGSPLTWPQVNRDRDWDGAAGRWRPGTPGAERAAARRAAREAAAGAGGASIESSANGAPVDAAPGQPPAEEPPTAPADAEPPAKQGSLFGAQARPGPGDRPEHEPHDDALPEGAPTAALPRLAGFGSAPVSPQPLAIEAVALPAALNDSADQLLHTLRLELLVLALVGLVVLWRRRRRLALVALACVIAWWLVGGLQVHRSHFLANRHMIIPVVVLLPIAGAGLALLWQRHVALRVLAVLLLAESIRAGTHLEREHVLPRLEALAWVREHTDPDELFLTQRQRDGWYAERTPVTSRFPMDMGALRDRLTRHHVRYMVVDLEDVQRFHPDWIERDWVVERQRFGEGDDVVVVLEPRFP